MIYSFNPITGEPITPRPLTLNYKIDQAMMLPHMRDEDFLKPLLLLDTLRQVGLCPELKDWQIHGGTWALAVSL